MFGNLFGKKKSEPTVQEIIDEIDKGLTEDRERNLKHLHAYGDKYKKHPQNLEILQHIGRLIARNMPDEAMEAFTAAISQDMERVQSELAEASRLIQERKIAEATKFLQEKQLDEGFAEELFRENELTVYLDFESSIDEAYYRITDQTSKEIKPAPLPFCQSYKLAAYVAFENKDYDKVLRITEKGLKRCPMSADLKFERCEVFKIREQMDDLWKAMEESGPSFYRRQDIAHQFRNLGWYFTHKKDWEPAIACYVASHYWHKSDMAQNELSYIVQCGGSTYEDVKAMMGDYARCKSALATKGLSMMPIDPKWIPLLKMLGKNGEENASYVFAAECYHWLHELTGDEEAKKRLEACVRHAPR